jgi:hypothetical protein
MSLKKYKQQYPKLSIPKEITVPDDFNDKDYTAPELPQLLNFDKGEYEGKLKKIMYMEKKGILINKTEQRRLSYNLGRLLRDQLSGMPARLAAKVSAEKDAKKVKRLIKNECDRCTRTILGRMADI